jgi:DNA (cytosine-5)-methyltransferase 1
MSWLISKALMNSLYSQEQAVESLVDTCLDGEQSVQLSGSNIPQAYCAPDKMMGFSRLSRFGMTYKPLTETRGEELLTLYLAAFHAPTFPQQEKEQELMEKPLECGEKWRGSFTKYDQDSCSWKTHQCSLLGDLDEFLETWPQWGLMRDGECWEQRTLEQSIKGTGFGLSPNGVDTFHTPNTTGLDGGSNSRKALRKRLLPTPDASQRGPTKDYNPQAKSQSGRTLQSFAAKFPTPQSNDAKNAVVRHRTKSLQVMLGGTIATDNPELIGGQLNPMWVEWLMGWPLGMTDLKPLEMDKCLSVQQQPGES